MRADKVAEYSVVIPLKKISKGEYVNFYSGKQNTNVTLLVRSISKVYDNNKDRENYHNDMWC